MPETILTVSQLNQRVKSLIELHYKNIWVEGEISNFAQPSSGHWYFTLKDSRAQVKCAMFKGRNRLVKISPSPGNRVKIRASASLYEGRGDYQLIVEHMDLAGTGDLHAQFEVLKAKLQAEGLFSSEAKQELPYLPEKIGIVTSPTGAAVHDITKVLQRRFPLIPLLVIPVAVQGQQAGQEIANAIHYANRYRLCDLLILGRGGGSLEDLWAFNEECVAQALFDSAIPTISAVGHEVDTTIADFVADVRAPTPSAAAEMATPDQAEMASYLRQIKQDLQQLAGQRLRPLVQKIHYLSKRLQSPEVLLQRHRQNLDHLEFKLKAAIKTNIGHNQQKVSRAQNSLTLLNPIEQLAKMNERATHLSLRLTQSFNRALETKKQRARYQVQLLNNLSPLNTLERGYAIVQTTDKQDIVRNTKQVTAGMKLNIKLAQGELACKVLEIKN